MKTVLLLAILVGFAGTLAAAHFVPGLSHDRLPSQTTVIANGGRSEQFLIRLPADRLAATDGAAAGLRAAAGDRAMLLPARFVAEPLLVEHFKIRDVAGNVIGVAARHWSTRSTDTTTTWSVLIPSRGTFVLSAPGEARGVLETELRRQGHSAGVAWTGKAVVPMTSEPGVVATGAGEFQRLVGTYTESWTVAGVDESGQLLGTIELNTITSRPE
jgi:hypothetical protein